MFVLELSLAGQDFSIIVVKIGFLSPFLFLVFELDQHLASEANGAGMLTMSNYLAGKKVVNKNKHPINRIAGAAI